jgi:cytochrome b-561
MLAVIAAWKSHTLKRPAPIPNLYSPHRCPYAGLRQALLAVPSQVSRFIISARRPFLVGRSWLGVLTLSLAVIQFLIGFGTYVWPKLSASRRAAAYPYHAFLGAVTFTTAIATMISGIQEKASFVQVLQATR